MGTPLGNAVAADSDVPVSSYPCLPLLRAFSRRTLGPRTRRARLRTVTPRILPARRSCLATTRVFAVCAMKRKRPVPRILLPVVEDVSFSTSCSRLGAQGTRQNLPSRAAAFSRSAARDPIEWVNMPTARARLSQNAMKGTLLRGSAGCPLFSVPAWRMFPQRGTPITLNTRPALAGSSGLQDWSPARQDGVAPAAISAPSAPGFVGIHPAFELLPSS